MLRASELVNLAVPFHSALFGQIPFMKVQNWLHSCTGFHLCRLSAFEARCAEVEDDARRAPL